MKEGDTIYREAVESDVACSECSIARLIISAY